MPQPNGNLWRHSRAKMDITSDQAAELLGIAGGALRQIETYDKAVSLALAYRAERLYKVPVHELIVDGGDGNKPKPEPKPAEPKVEPTAPPPRRNGKDNRRGPRRSVDLKAAS